MKISIVTFIPTATPRTASLRCQTTSAITIGLVVAMADTMKMVMADLDMET